MCSSFRLFGLTIPHAQLRSVLLFLELRIFNALFFTLFEKSFAKTFGIFYDLRFVYLD